MMTKRQEELVRSFLSDLADGDGPIYREIITCLTELGYRPRKERSYILFMHPAHKKQIAKMGFHWTKDHAPYFAMCFSGCKGYPQRFSDIVGDYIAKNPTRLFPHCGNGHCIYRSEEDAPPPYGYVFPDGTVKFLCGAKALIIRDITVDDAQGITNLIREEHAYLMAHEPGIPEKERA